MEELKRAKEDEEYPELHEAIEYMNERQGQLRSMMEQKQKLKSAALEYLWREMLQEMVLDERISADGIDFAGEDAGDEGALEGKDTVAAGIGSTLRAAAKLRNGG